VRLKDACEDAGQYGLNVSPDEYRSAGTRMLRTSDLVDEGLTPDSQGIFLEVSIPPPQILRENDLLLSRAGTIGRAYLVPESAAGSTFAGFLIRFRPRREVDPRYLHYALRSKPTQDQIRADAVTSTIQNFNADRYANLRIPDASPTAQRQIADFLDDRVARIDQIITARRVQAQRLDESYASMRRSALTTAPGATSQCELPWLATVPESWAVRRLSQVARMGTGHTPSRSEPDYWVDCDIPWLTTGDVHRFRHDEVDVIHETTLNISALGLANSAAVLHPARTVALSRTASAGFAVIMGSEMATSQDFATWTCGAALLPDYLLHLLRVMQPYLLGNLSMGSTHKTIYLPDLMDIRIPVPDLATQRVAVEQVREAAASRQEITSAINKQIRGLEEYKQALITAAVTGELDVTTAGSGIPA